MIKKIDKKKLKKKESVKPKAGSGELAEITNRGGTELEELKRSRAALLNILEDAEEERKKAEEESNKTKAIIANFADGLLVFDAENKLSFINHQAEIILDIKGRDIVNRHFLELTTFPTFKPLTAFLGEKIKEVSRKEFQLGKNLVLEVSVVPVISGKERWGNLIILHDITREKLIERMKTEFVSLAAHQLRTPLSAIKWTIRMLLDGDLGKISEEQKDFLEKTYRSNERMIDLINDLLNVTRIEEGRYLFKPVFSDVEVIVQLVMGSYKEGASRKNIKIELIRPAEKLPQILVDVEKTKLAIQNLLDNAVRYTRPGGKVTISLKHVKKDKEIEFSIADTGVGIPKDQYERVFTKFFRAVNVMRMETEGTGLGLFITKNIIEAHGGRIWFESEEGKGTTFYFRLPAKMEFEEFVARH